MTRSDIDVLVVGAGVSGLTTAVCLAEAGLRVLIKTEALPSKTTSAAAGAMWGPYLVEPRQFVERWSLQSLDELKVLASDPATGVRMVTGVEVGSEAVAPPWWATSLDDFRILDGGILPPGFVAGWRFTAPIVDMSQYLDYLVARLQSAGGHIEQDHLSSLEDAAGIAPRIVNSAGMGARGLVPDPELRPIRGQMVLIENPGIDEFFSEDTGDSSELRCIYPHRDTVVLGGSAEDGSWDLEPDLAQAQRIIGRCAEIDPRIADARVVEHRVGLRPTRNRVRVDTGSSIGGTQVFHNYGHGGAGVTLSWGCARQILSMIRDTEP